MSDGKSSRQKQSVYLVVDKDHNVMWSGPRKELGDAVKNVGASKVGRIYRAVDQDFALVTDIRLTPKPAPKAAT